jgi:hypothetical protein
MLFCVLLRHLAGCNWLLKITGCRKRSPNLPVDETVAVSTRNIQISAFYVPFTDGFSGFW